MITQLIAILGAQLARLGLLFGVNKLIAIYLGPTDFAIWGHVASVITFYISISNCGVGQGITSVIAQNNGKVEYKVWLTVSQLYVLLGTFIVFAIHWVLKCAYSSEVLNSITLVDVIFLSVSGGLAIHFQSVSTGIQKSNVYSVMLLIQGFILYISVLIQGKNGSLASLVQAYVTSCLATAGTWIFVCWKTNIKWIGNNNFSKETLQKCGSMAPFIVNAAANAIFGTVSVIGVRQVVILNDGNVQAGLWQAVQRLSDIGSAMVVGGMASVVLPRIAKNGNIEENFRMFYITYVKVIVVGIFLYQLVVYSVGEQVIKLLYSSEFIGSLDIWKLQAVGDSIRAFVLPFTSYLYFKGKVRGVWLCEILYASLYLSSTYVLGYVGLAHAAPYSYGLANCVLLIALIFMFKTKHGINNEN